MWKREREKKGPSKKGRERRERGERVEGREGEGVKIGLRKTTHTKKRRRREGESRKPLRLAVLRVLRCCVVRELEGDGRKEEAVLGQTR